MPRTEHLLYVLLELSVALLAVAGNVLVCWAVCVNSNLQSVTNFFVVSLAVADIGVGLLAIPFAITISTGFCANFYGCLFMACFVLVLTQSSIFSLLAIAVDRYMAIKSPLRYNSLVTAPRAKAVITLCWVLSTAIGLTPLLGWNTGWNGATSSSSSRGRCPKDMTECLFERVVTLDYMVYFNFFGCVLLPLLVMLVIYAHIFMAARRQLRLIGLKVAQAPAVITAPSGSPRSTLQKEVHAAKSLAIIVGMFALCWLPLHLINCFNHLCSDCSRPHVWVMNIAIILSHANSVVNPFIYAYRIREFRQTFGRILYRHILGCRDRQGAGVGDGDGRGAGSSRSSIVATSSCSHASKDSPCGTVTNSFIVETAMKRAAVAREGSLCLWRPTPDSAPSSSKPNGGHGHRSVQSERQQPPRIEGYAAPDKESDRGLRERTDGGAQGQRGGCITLVNVHTLSVSQSDSVQSAE